MTVRVLTGCFPMVACIAAITLLCVSCAAPPPKKAAEPPPLETVSAPVQQAEPPPLLTAEGRAVAQKKAIEARDLLQNGEEKSARDALEQALKLDPGNELARKLLDQITADPEAELGTTHFDYVIQAGDSISRIAERFLGDRLRFYILARYNGIANPNRIAVGQVVKIPGRGAKAGAPSPASPAATPASPKAPPTKPATATKPPVPADTASPATNPVAQPPAAATPAAPAVQVTPRTPEGAAAPAPAPAPVDEAAKRKVQAKRFNQEALAAFHKQDLDTAIRKWTQVIELEPDNESARLNRAKAMDLKERIAKFPKK